ncbi:zinc ABC transporter substrate-binding protein [Marinobacter salarius]|jgi:zinc transport system substrate-binding protein|uniref:zinc ABC transporter substrate-binding protein n=1 Tax=Marinobacter salarius TaxID=1420917 RepID=UPI0018F138C2|nr:zinc ABC transporter substrate-binding protein [Marinobacter salarius]MBJ7275925.1 zinc ABC transporter substrate-binding protein [Marinobacter salarius]
MITSRFTGLIALGAATLLASASTLASTQVVTSLKPIELLVRAIAADDVEITTLVQPGASPHNYSMKPSQRRALEAADAIFWVGPEMETFLTRLLGGSEFRDRTYSLMHGENVPEVQSDSGHGDHDDHEESGGHDDHRHDHGSGEDPHIWLDPALAVEMARDIHRVLATLKSADTHVLDANLARFEQAMAETETAINQRLDPARDIDLFTYHDAFTRFVGHYNMNLEGILTLNPELSPGAGHIAEVQEKLRNANQPCLLTEPQFNRQWWRSITEGLDITFSTWDPLATDIETDQDGYIAFQQSLADAVLKCLPEDAK